MAGVTGLSLASNPESPIVFLKLQKSTGSIKSDLQLFDDIADRVSRLFYLDYTKLNQFLLSFSNIFVMALQLLKEHSVLAVASKRSTLDKCRLPVGIRLFVSAAHSEADLIKASESLKTVAESVLKNHI